MTEGETKSETAASLGVLHLDSEPVWRGEQRQVLELVIRLRSRGHLALLACRPDSPLAEHARAREIEPLPLRLRSQADLRPLPQLIRTLEEPAIHLIHSHSSRTLLLGAVLARALGLRHVHSRRVDFPIKNNPISRWKYAHGADRILAVSQRIRRVLIQAGVAEKRIRVVLSGIDPAPLEKHAGSTALRRELGLGPRDLLVGNAAHLAAHKGHGLLVEAAAHVLRQRDDVHFVVAGEGEERSAIEEAIRQHDLQERFRLLGYREDQGRLLASMDLFVMPSREEGLGTAILDAMALSLPVAAFRVGGIPEIVEEGRTGLLADPEDPGSLAEAILRLLGDADLRNSMGRAGRARLEDSFHIEKTVSATVGAYRELLEGGSPAP